LPRREGGRGTEISSLDGGQNLGEMEDVQYFMKKLYRSLNIPESRIEAENGFNMGRSSEITRDEVKFFRFIDRMRMKFSDLFMQSLKTQLILRGVMKSEDWDKIYQDISFTFKTESYFHELKEAEILKERIDALQTVDEYVGKYYSVEYVRKNILKQSEQEIKEMDSQISKESDNGDIAPEGGAMPPGGPEAGEDPNERE
jgi:hypothetical protein